MFVPIAVAAKQTQIKAVIADAMTEFAPSVQRINYEIAQDWSGDWAVFFRVLLSDEASERKKLRDITKRIMSRMTERLDLPELGLFPYFDFRSQSEQAKQEEPAWA